MGNKSSSEGQEYLLRSIPSVDDLLKMEAIDSLTRVYSREMVVYTLREQLSHLRGGILSGEVKTLYPIAQIE